MFSIDADDERSQSIEGWDSEKSPLESLAEIKVAVESSEQYLKFLVEEKNKVEARVRNIENQLDENFVKGSEDLKNLLQSCLSFHSDFGFPSKVFRKQKEEFFRDLEEKRNELEKVVASPQPDVIALHSKWDELKREEAALLRKKATLEGETNEVKSLENCLQALTKQYAREKEAELLALNRLKLEWDRVVNAKHRAQGNTLALARIAKNPPVVPNPGPKPLLWREQKAKANPLNAAIVVHKPVESTVALFGQPSDYAASLHEIFQEQESLRRKWQVHSSPQNLERKRCKFENSSVRIEELPD